MWRALLLLCGVGAGVAYAARSAAHAQAAGDEAEARRRAARAQAAHDEPVEEQP